MKKMLVGYVIDPEAGGIDKYLMNLYAQTSDNIRVDFLTNKNTVKLESVLTKSVIYEVPTLKHPFQQYNTISKILNDGNYDIAYFNISTALMFIGPLAAKKAGVKRVVVHSHTTGYDTENRYKRCLLTILHYISTFLISYFATDYLACSQEAADWMFPLVKKKIRIVNNTIDSSIFAFNPQIREQVRKELTIKDDEFVLGHVGNFLYQKNHKFLLELFNEYHKIDDKAKLMLVGDGPLKTEIEQYVDRNDLVNSVVFIGRTNEVFKYLMAMDMFLFPSNFEGFGIVALEAQCSGLKCLMSEAVPKRVSVTDNCIYLPINDIDIWLDSIKQNKDYKRKSQEKRIIKSGFSIDSMNFDRI